MARRILDIHIEEIRNLIKDSKLKKEINYEYDYDLLGIDRELDMHEKYKVIQKFLNDYLLEIKELFFKKNVKTLKVNSEEYLKHFTFNSNIEISDEDKNNIKNASDLLAYQLYSKTVGVNGRKITFPINIVNIEELMIPTYIKSQYVMDVIIRVIVNLAIIYNNLKNM